jgi:small subunit ribosomal protein S6
MAVFVPELSDEELVEEIERVTRYISDTSGVVTEVLRESPWGRRRLAYTIRFNSVDYRDGIYVVFHFDNVPNGISDIERELKLDVRVMRYLLVHDDPLAGEKSNGQVLEGEAAEGSEGAEGEVAELTDVTTDTAPVEAAVVQTEEAEPVADIAQADESPAEESAPVTDEAPAEEVAPVTNEAPAEEAAPVAEEAPAEEETPAADEAAANTATSDEETKED